MFMHVIMPSTMPIIGILLLCILLCMLQESYDDADYNSYHYAYYMSPIIMLSIVILLCLLQESYYYACYSAYYYAYYRNHVTMHIIKHITRPIICILRCIL